MSNESLKIGKHWANVAAELAHTLYRMEIEKGFYGNADNYLKTMNDARQAAKYIDDVPPLLEALQIAERVLSYHASTRKAPELVSIRAALARFNGETS